jgi:hypothetical protein
VLQLQCIDQLQRMEAGREGVRKHVELSLHQEACTGAAAAVP